MKKLKKIPSFKDEDEERKFWATRDSAEYLDWSKGQRVRFPNLKPSLRTISIRLPQWMIDEMKELANERDVPYQSLLKIFLAEKIGETRTSKQRKPTREKRKFSRPPRAHQ